MLVPKKGNVVIALTGIYGGQRGLVIDRYGYLGYRGIRRRAVTVIFPGNIRWWYHIGEVAVITS
jgi:hypothetical protein